MTRLDWFDDDSVLQALVLAELGENARAIFQRLRRLNGGRSVLRFLYDQGSTLMTAEDIAFHVSMSPPAARHCLLVLEQLGLIQRIEAVRLTLFGLNTAEAQYQLVRDLLRWQDLWHKRLARIENIVGGDSRPRSAARLTGSERLAETGAGRGA